MESGQWGDRAAYRQHDKRHSRLTLIIDSGRIAKVFYPVFPPDQNAAAVLDWLSGDPSRGAPTAHSS